jgi:penicillin amidase
MERVISFVMAECYEADPSFDYTTVRRREGAIWKLVRERPAHLLNPRYGSWADLLTASIEALIEEADREHDGDLTEQTWADYNPVAYRHPLSGAVPLLGRWLDMPHQDFAGDLFTPRMHFGISGASERMGVAGGNRTASCTCPPDRGHPLSPFYANSHGAFARGEATPFLQGATDHTLMLVP